MLINVGGVEMNQLVAPIVDNTLLFSAVKDIPMVMIYQKLKEETLDKKVASKILTGLNIFMAGLVVNNLYQLNLYYKEK